MVAPSSNRTPPPDEVERLVHEAVRLSYREFREAGDDPQSAMFEALNRVRMWLDALAESKGFVPDLDQYAASAVDVEYVPRDDASARPEHLWLEFARQIADQDLTEFDAMALVGRFRKEVRKRGLFPRSRRAS